MSACSSNSSRSSRPLCVDHVPLAAQLVSAASGVSAADLRAASARQLYLRARSDLCVPAWSASCQQFFGEYSGTRRASVACSREALCSSHSSHCEVRLAGIPKLRTGGMSWLLSQPHHSSSTIVSYKRHLQHRSLAALKLHRRYAQNQPAFSLPSKSISHRSHIEQLPQPQPAGALVLADVQLVLELAHEARLLQQTERLSML